MMTATYNAGVALIVHRTGQTQIVVSAAADVILAGEGVVDARDAMAVAAGYLALVEQVRDMRAELAAARAGTIGVEHATAMQDARWHLAGLHQACRVFLEVYDKGDAPDDKVDRLLRESNGMVENWLVADSTAAIARAKVLKGGAQ